MFQAEFVTLVSLKVPSGKSFFVTGRLYYVPTTHVSMLQVMVLDLEVLVLRAV